MESANLRTVEAIYEAFGSGEVSAILERMSPRVEWEYGRDSTPVPWLTPGQGRDHVGRFFATLAGELVFESFNVNHILGGDGVVVLWSTSTRPYGRPASESLNVTSPTSGTSTTKGR